MRETGPPIHSLLCPISLKLRMFFFDPHYVYLFYSYLFADLKVVVPGRQVEGRAVPPSRVPTVDVLRTAPANHRMPSKKKESQRIFPENAFHIFLPLFFFPFLLLHHNILNSVVDPDPASDPSIIKQFLLLCDFFMTFYQCSGSTSGSGSVGYICFWASRIRIQIR